MKKPKQRASDEKKLQNVAQPKKPQAFSPVLRKLSPTQTRPKNERKGQLQDSENGFA